MSSRTYSCMVGLPYFFSIEADKRMLERIDRDLHWLAASEPASGTQLFTARFRRIAGSLDSSRAVLSRGLERWGRSTFSDGRCAVRQFWDWCLVKVSGRVLEVHFCEFREAALVSWARQLLGKSDLQGLNAERELFALRMGLHFPLFHELAVGGKGVLHGAAVEKNGRCLVLVGFEGVGKSTLALYLHEKLGYSLVADNFVVYDAHGFVYPFIESARLAQDSSEAVGLRGGEAVLDRRLFAAAERGTRHDRLAVAALIQTAISDKPGLTELPPELMQRRLLAMTESVVEFLDLKQFRAIARLAGGNFDPAAEANVLASFVSKTRPRLLNLGGLERLACQAELVDRVL